MMCLLSKGKQFAIFSEDKCTESCATAPQGTYQYVEHGRRQCYQIRVYKNDADFRNKRKSLAVALLKSRVSVSFSSPGLLESHRIQEYVLCLRYSLSYAHVILPKKNPLHLRLFSIVSLRPGYKV